MSDCLRLAPANIWRKEPHARLKAGAQENPADQVQEKGCVRPRRCGRSARCTCAGGGVYALGFAFLRRMVITTNPRATNAVGAVSPVDSQAQFRGVLPPAPPSTPSTLLAPDAGMAELPDRLDELPPPEEDGLNAEDDGVAEVAKAALLDITEAEEVPLAGVDVAKEDADAADEACDSDVAALEDDDAPETVVEDVPPVSDELAGPPELEEAGVPAMVVSEIRFPAASYTYSMLAPSSKRTADRRPAASYS